MPMDVQDLDCDFLCFSSHKMLGPLGIGILYGKQLLLEQMPPFLFGGGMVSSISKETTWNELPWKFEAGTPDIGGAVGFSAAVTYLQTIGMNNVFGHDQDITSYAFQQLKKQKDVIIYGPEKRTAVISFNIKNIHAHDVTALLDAEGIACRAGHHCAQPLFHTLKVPAAVRVSFYIYNTHEEVDLFIAALNNVRKVFA
jgi:cysteine desulfurase/selenocysteine lyase